MNTTCDYIELKSPSVVRWPVLFSDRGAGADGFNLDGLHRTKGEGVPTFVMARAERVSGLPRKATYVRVPPPC